MCIDYSHHSIKVAKDRMNLGSSAAKKMISRAWANGKRSYELPSKERSFLEKKEKSGCTAVLYSGYCFIFSDEDKCLTVYPAPKFFATKKTRYDGKVEVRNPKAYSRHYGAEYYVA